MSRTLTAATWQGITAARSNCAVMLLLVIDHDDLAAPIRITDNNENLSYGGNTYYAWPVKVSLPDETEDAIGTATVTISNVDRAITEALRELATPPSISLVAAYWVDAAAFDPMVTNLLTLKQVTITAETITGQAGQDDGLEDEVGSVTVTPHEFPGAF